MTHIKTQNDVFNDNIFENPVALMYHSLIHLSLMSVLTSENALTKGAQTWTPQKENNPGRRDSFVLKQTHFSANNDV